MARPKVKHDPHFGPLVRKKRKQMGLTLQALCDDADLSVGYLSQVERGNATPSLGTLSKLANALGVGVEFFVTVQRPEDALMRAGHRAPFTLDDSSIVYESVSRDIPGGDLSSYIIHIPPGFCSETINREGEEVVFVLEGEIIHTLDDNLFHLHAGDSLHFLSTQFHTLSNPTDKPARLLWTCTPSLFAHSKKSKRRFLSTDRSKLEETNKE